MDRRPHCSGIRVTRVLLFFCRRKQEEVATLESTIRQRSEQQKKAGVELDATCHICLKTKFADGVGHICHYCKIRCCARCGGKVTLRSNKVSLAICAFHYPDLSLAHQQPLVPFLLTFHTPIPCPHILWLGVTVYVFGSHRINICYRFLRGKGGSVGAILYLDSAGAGEGTWKVLTCPMVGWFLPGVVAEREL